MTFLPRRLLSALVLAVALALGLTACVREVIQPVTESTLVVARASDQATLSWTAVAGMYYTILYASSQNASDWKAMDGAVNLRATISGPVAIHDRVPATKPRFYRLLQDSKPIPLTPN